MRNMEKFSAFYTMIAGLLKTGISTVSNFFGGSKQPGILSGIMDMISGWLDSEGEGFFKGWMTEKVSAMPQWAKKHLPFGLGELAPEQTADNKPKTEGEKAGAGTGASSDTNDEQARIAAKAAEDARIAEAVEKATAKIRAEYTAAAPSAKKPTGAFNLNSPDTRTQETAAKSSYAAQFMGAALHIGNPFKASGTAIEAAATAFLVGKDTGSLEEAGKAFTESLYKNSGPGGMN